MGLSTASVRMLFLTAQEYQKNDEIRSLTGKKRLLLMQSEDAARVAKAIRNTKHLVLSNVNGEKDEKGNAVLSYDALMGTGAYNESERDRYFIVDAQKKLVLDNKTAEAAANAGIVQGKTDNRVSKDNFEAFMIGLGKTKSASESWYDLANDKLTSSLTPEDKSNLSLNFVAKYGSYPTANTSSTSVSTLLESMSNTKIDGASLKDIYNGTANVNIQIYEQGDHGGWGDANKVVTEFSTRADDVKKAVLTATGQDKGTPLEKLLTSYIDSVKNSLKSYGSGGGVDVDRGYSIPSAGTEGTSKEVVTHWTTSSRGSSDNDHVGLRAQTFVKRMLEIAIQYLKGQGVDGKKSSLSGQSSSTEFTQCVNANGYNVPDYEKQLKSFIGDAKFNSAVKFLKGENSGSIPDTDTAKFYYDLFTQICAKGYTQDSDAHNNSKLQAKLENGTYQIISNKKDNYETADIIQNTDFGIYEEVIGGEEYDKEADDYLMEEKARINREENDIDEQLTVKQTELQAIKNWKESERSQVMQRAQTDFQLFVQA